MKRLIAILAIALLLVPAFSQSTKVGAGTGVVKTGVGSGVIKVAAFVVAGDTAAITGQSLGTSRNDFDGRVGFLFVTTSTLTITSVGIWVIAGHQNHTHTVEITDLSGGSMGGYSVTADLTLATPGQFFYVTLASPQTLVAGTYALMAHESSGDGDNWYSDDTTVTTTSAITISNSCYAPDSGGFFASTSGNHAYVPVSFKYH